MLSLKFLLTWQRRNISKLPKITTLRWFLTSKLISKCCNFSMDSNKVKAFLALVTRYLMICLGHFKPLTILKFSWRWGGLPPPFKHPKQKGARPPSRNATPWCIFWIGDGVEKVVTFLNNIFKKNTKNKCLGPKWGIFLDNKWGVGRRKRR
jgi:hypothetical protein